MHMIVSEQLHLSVSRHSIFRACSSLYPYPSKGSGSPIMQHRIEDRFAVPYLDVFVEVGVSSPLRTVLEGYKAISDGQVLPYSY